MVDAVAPVDLDQLLDVVQRFAAARGEPRMGVLADFGLFIHDTLDPWTYTDSPSNGLCFASTGGNGVHFTALQLPQCPQKDGPVVMTVPMLGGNVVLAESLAEFLGLGYFRGWFDLEQLAYRRAWTIELYDQTDEPPPKLIQRFSSAIGFAHVPLSLERLEELAARYLPLVTTKHQHSPR